jgi:hypothetical protein
LGIEKTTSLLFFTEPENNTRDVIRSSVIPLPIQPEFLNSGFQIYVALKVPCPFGDVAHLVLHFHCCAETISWLL